ncbi:FAD-dependent oxidoreductase [Paenibacillus sp. YPG26]|uniref:phytoene desaturase family protein n=1 Tax=Paenibacillus sp. YPG26 TaxID=2878915 RepID=UPI00203C9D5B|nr:FAD-dependent oxidoreductase [Paenibacillus sp. YPG26]USB33949.1 FAD-dependent oxidoreductase [Paenibacillus sp. YPG26]
MLMNKYDTVVIGGGLAGFIAAIYLAKGGHSVALVEKSGRWGGRAITNKKNQAYLNLGGHALYQAGRAYSILKELGVRLEGGKPASHIHAVWNNQSIPLLAGPASLLSSKLLTWPNKMNLMRLMMKLKQLKPDQMKAGSLRAWAEHEIHDPMVRHIFYALCRTSTYSHAPDDQLAGPALAQVQRSLQGVLYLNHGWQTVIDQLKVIAEQAGVHLVSGQSVIEIVHDQGRVQSVALEGGASLEAHHVISTASPAEIYKLVRGAEHTELKRWKENTRPSAAACLDVGLKRLPVAAREFAIGLDQPIFFSHHTAHAKLSDDGTRVVHLVKYLGQGESDPDADYEMLTAAMSLIQPGWEQEVVTQRYLPRMTVTHNYLHVGQPDSLAGPSVRGIEGLYVAGDWVSQGEMLADASAASALRAAQYISQRSKRNLIEVSARR